MGKLNVTDFFLYRWRYVLAVLVAVGVFAGIFVLVGFYTPGGLSQREMASATASIHTPVEVLNGSSPDHIVQLPYQALQKASINLLGVSDIAIKLPSLLLAGLSALLLYGVMRLWFRRNVAVITSLIAITSAEFLFLAQLGTPAISGVFWAAFLLFTTSMLAYSARYRALWIVAASIGAGLSLYSPMGIFLIAALSITCLIHPHSRFVVFSQSKILLGICLALFGLVVTPLILGIIAQPQLLIELAGFESLSMPTLDSIGSTLQPFASFNAPEGGIALYPVYGLATGLLAVLGALRLFTAKYTAKSYIISLVFAFIVVAIVLGILLPSYTFVPILLLVAFGIDYLISSWYRLFPFNPYARVAGLLPLAVLVIGISFTELERYVYTYHYTPRAVSAFTKDLQLVDRFVDENHTARMTLLVQSDQVRFYNDYASRLPDTVQLTVTDRRDEAATRANDELIIAQGQFASRTNAPDAIAVTSQSENAARLYLYKNGYQ